MKRYPFWLSLLAVLVIVPLSLALPYKQALPGYEYRFPGDHAAHEAYKTEWWYYTGHLQSADQHRYGYELTFFRIGQEGAEGQAYAAHLALTDEGGRRFEFAEKLNRSGWSVAGAREDVYYVWNELWSAQLLGDRHILQAGFSEEDGGTALHLMLTPQKPPVIHGRNGVSQKAACTGCASHYYSMTRLGTEGFLIRNGEAVPVTGLSWMDHEFGSNQLTAEQVGWDWFSLQLSDGADVMIYLLRREDGTLEAHSSGTLVAPDGSSRHLTLDQFTVTPSGRTWKSPKSGGVYPMGWRIRIPSANLDVTVDPVFEDQELATEASTGVVYWEGSSRVRGSHNGRPVRGQAYVEMTGYARAFDPEI